MQVLSPTLIAYRVSAGNAWTRDTTQQTTIGLSVTSTAVGRTVLGDSGEDSMKCGAIGLDPKPGNIRREDQVPMEV